MKNYDKKFFEDNIHKVVSRPIIFPDKFKIKSQRIVIQKIEDVNTDLYMAQIRPKDNIEVRSTQLNTSFEGGIDWNEPPPVIRKRKGTNPDLLDAYGRFEMFEKGGQKYWIMVEVECDDKTALKIRGWCNRTKSSKTNTIADCVYQIEVAVSKKYIKATKRNYQTWLNDIEPHLDSNTKSQIINTLVDRLGTNPVKPKKFISLSASSVMKNWVRPHFGDAKKIGFALAAKGAPKYSKVSDCYFGVVQRTYEDRKLLQAIMSYISSGVGYKLLGLSDSKATSKKALKNQRTSIKTKLTKLQNGLDRLYGKSPDCGWENIIDVFGFIPEHSDEYKKEPIQYKKLN